MKKALTFSSLFVLGGYAMIELANSLGAQLPDELSLGNAFAAFAGILFVAIMLADYGPKVRPIPLPVRVRRFSQPPRISIAAAHHHVYAIRRGAEAARLGVPSRVVVFPRNTPTRCRRAA